MKRVVILERVYVRWEDRADVRVLIDGGYAFVNACAAERGYYVLLEE